MVLDLSQTLISRQTQHCCLVATDVLVSFVTRGVVTQMNIELVTFDFYQAEVQLVHISGSDTGNLSRMIYTLTSVDMHGQHHKFVKVNRTKIPVLSGAKIKNKVLVYQAQYMCSQYVNVVSNALNFVTPSMRQRKNLEPYACSRKICI